MAELELLDRVQDALNNNPHLAGRQLRFESRAGEVILRGTVKSYYQKQMAQETLLKLEGIHHVENQIEVTWA